MSPNVKFLLLLACFPFVHSANDPRFFSGNHLHTFAASRSFSGVVAIAENGRVRCEKAQGLADRGLRTPLTADDRFFIGSISKQITATMVLLEAEAGHLRLNATLHDYLPELKDTWADSVTLQQLLNHTSGITELGKMLSAPPGAHFAYNNLNYDLLGRVLEKVSGKSYETLAGNLFARYGMNSTIAQPLEMDKRTLVTVDRLVKGYYEQPDSSLEEATDLLTLLHTPSGGIISRLADLTQWNIRLHTGKILKAASYQTMIRPLIRRAHRWGNWDMAMACK